jgi:hypothetical protein
MKTLRMPFIVAPPVPEQNTLVPVLMIALGYGVYVK